MFSPWELLLMVIL